MNPTDADAKGRRRLATAQKRKAKFPATQAALPAEDRLDANRDWDAFVGRQLSKGQEGAISAIKRTFLKFLTDDDLPIKLSPDAAANCFVKEGTAVTSCLIRAFLEFMAQSRKGLHPKANGRLKTHTLHKYLVTLGVALKRAQNPLEREIANAVHAWIDGHLVPKGVSSVDSAFIEASSTRSYVARFGVERHTFLP